MQPVGKQPASIALKHSAARIDDAIGERVGSAAMLARRFVFRAQYWLRRDPERAEGRPGSGLYAALQIEGEDWADRGTGRQMRQRREHGRVQRGADHAQVDGRRRPSGWRVR